ncbi:hypothetical protein K7432_011645 [Basidiobolus ranarum]|uniref:Uncharacterized protein n=1 Tax=Basidiobolus ranarum TaxID=34480 RepID=A0ABR2WM01_9FUNG
MAPKTLLFALIGSLGDTLPFLAIAEYLTSQDVKDQQQQYEIIIMGHLEHEPLISSYGFQFAPIHGSLLTAMSNLTEKEGKQSGWNQMTSLKVVFGNTFKQWHSDILAACNKYQPDLVVLATFPAMCGVHAVREMAAKSPIPYIVIHTVPTFPTSDFAPPTGGFGFTLPFGFLNKATWSLLSVFNQYVMMTPILRDLRLAIGLPPTTPEEEAAQRHRRDYEVETLFIYSPNLLPTPKDWPNTHKVIGSPYLHRDQRFLTTNDPAKIYPNSSYNPPESISTFLAFAQEKKLPVVYVGFGSMLGMVVDHEHSMKLLDSFTDAILQLNEEEVPAALIFATKGFPIQSDSSQFQDNSHEAIISYVKSRLPPNLMKFADHILYSPDYIPHSYLFPKCDFMVHHGGAGTVHAGIMHSIRPQSTSTTNGADIEVTYEGTPFWVVPCSTIADQPFWGGLTHSLALGPKPIPFNAINTDNAKVAIKSGLENKDWRWNVGKLGVQIWKEGNPAEKVRETIERVLLDSKQL